MPAGGVPGVTRRVHGDEALPCVEQFLGHRIEDDPLTGDEVGRPLGDLDQVRVPHHRPEPLVVRILEEGVGHGLMPGNGPVATQFCEDPFTVGRRARPELGRRQVCRVVGTLGSRQHRCHETSWARGRILSL